MVALHLVPPAAVRPLSILAEEFPTTLATFNSLTRDMRDAGIVIKALELLDNKIFVDHHSLDLLSRRFGHELRGMRYVAEGRFARNTVMIRGVGVVWFTLVKEQNQ